MNINDSRNNDKMKISYIGYELQFIYIYIYIYIHVWQNYLKLNTLIHVLVNNI